MEEKETSKNEKLNLMSKVIFSLIFPTLLCFIYCLLRGIDFFNLYLPNSINNDSLFYYKVVEGMVNFGMPKGYFGFNESQALLGSLPAWSPVIYIPWVIFGKVLGWNYGSLIISNIVYFSLAFGAFSLITRIKWKNLLILSGMLLLFPSFLIHLCVGLPEAITVSVSLLFLASALRYPYGRHKKLYLVLMLASIFFLVLARPYMVVFSVVPIVFLCKSNGKKGLLLGVGCLLLDLAGYVLLTHFFTAEYLYPMYDMSLLDLLIHGHLRGAYIFVVKQITTVLPGIWAFIKNAFSYGLTAGTQYVVALISSVLLFVLGLQKKNREKRLIIFTFFFANLALLMAVVLLLGKANEGGRHFFVFSVMGIFLLASLELESTLVWMDSVMGVLLVLFVVRGALVPTDYDIPAFNSEVKEKITYWEKAFSENDVEASEECSFANTVIWTLTDVCNDKTEIVNHRNLFALPKGFAISCCDYGYVAGNFENLQSRYIAVYPNGEISKLCVENGYEEIGHTSDCAIFKRY